MLLEKLKKLRTRFDELNIELSKPEVITDARAASKFGRELKKIVETLPLINEYEATLKSIYEAEAILSDGGDPDLINLAKEELPALLENKESLEHKLIFAIVPPDENEGKDVIIEIRAGTGGEEAALFAGNLFRMYSRLAERKGLKLNIIESNTTDIGGVKEVVFELSGETAYSSMKFESGVHRVQRVPETESGGRIHTSAASVAVLPIAEEVDIEIKQEDLKIDTYCSTGAGGQHVNKTQSAIRITHLPTGVIVTCQDERSQLKNRLKAMVVLRSRLFAAKQQELQSERAKSRRLQVGSGDRSDKIRTYNFPQNRVTDHRINFSMHNLPGVLDGDLDDLIEALKKADLEDALKEME